MRDTAMDGRRPHPTSLTALKRLLGHLPLNRSSLRSSLGKAFGGDMLTGRQCRPASLYFQISSQYSWIVRSLENFPAPAMLPKHIFANFTLFFAARMAFSLASM